MNGPLRRLRQKARSVRRHVRRRKQQLIEPRVLERRKVSEEIRRHVL